VKFYIRKASGEKELFDIRKFRRSLKKAGASDTLIKKLVTDIEKQPGLRNTREIYDFALSHLQEQSPPVAARYNIKRALLELGPAGFPFEQFVEKIFKAQGYETEQGLVVQGDCVEHEVDVVAMKEDKHYMIECKFHNRQGLKTDVKVTLYIKARFDDVEKAWVKKAEHGHKFHQAWIATNTKFTTQAIAYAECIGIQLLGWSYPQKNNLPELIDKFDLHPITALPSLSRQQKRAFIKNGFVLCRDAEKQKGLLKSLGFSDHQIKKLISELQAVCKIKAPLDTILRKTQNHSG